ncbi:MAG: hypothetical protein QOH07_3354, partial [Mycobacterium sp.]|nr:hypothetical protein [Mycobacterium sp.]
MGDGRMASFRARSSMTEQEPTRANGARAFAPDG